MKIMNKASQIGTLRFQALAFGLLLPGLVGCSTNFHPASEPVAMEIVSSIGCGDLKSTLWSELYRLSDTSFPSESDIELKLVEKLGQKLGQKLSAQADPSSVQHLAQAAAKLYGHAIRAASLEGDRKAVMRTLAAIELGDEETPEHAESTRGVREALLQIDAIAKSADLSCERPAPIEAPPSEALPSEAQPNDAAPPTRQTKVEEGELLDSWKAQTHKAVYGAWKTMATAYQSCDAASREALDDTNPDVSGIEIMTNKKPASGGLWREVTSLSSFLRSQPYFIGRRDPEAGCFDVEKMPLIYDFGGKPEYSSSSTSDLDLFTENGSGATNQLGIDCSGYVMTAYLIAGLKVSRDEPHRPQFAGAIPARNFMRPDGDMKKLTCFKYVEVKSAQALKPGDVLASATHVVMVDVVGDDPFGINWITTASQCTEANVVPSRFNFTVVHSGSVKNGIGISRMKAKDYFDNTGAMGVALRSYGVAACKARFGVGSTPMPSSARLVRHSGEAKCIDKPVALRRSSCLKTCRASLPSK